MHARYLRLLLLIIFAVALAAENPGRRTGPRPALWLDNDMAPIPEPARRMDTLNYDFFYATFGQAPRSFVGRLGEYQPAWNLNAWDEVPDSSWYTNRNHRRRMTPEEVARGANLGAGPDLSGALMVLEGKTAGTSLGFGRTRDAAGKVYYIKFDSAEYPELTTSSEIISARLFHALGFTVPQEWIIYVRPDQIHVDDRALIWDKSGRQRKMTRDDVENVLAGSARAPDGRYRAIASLALPGANKGGFLFHGTRRDDPNDLIPHQHRRELRALRLLAAWLNHYDIRPGNTIDLYVEENGRKFLRHYLQDFGSTLGSASYFPKVPRMGFSYVWDTKEASRPFLTFGVYQPYWREHPAPVRFPSVGRLESEMFTPMAWKAALPLVAFDYLDDADAFWAAKLVMALSDEQIRAAVHEGQLSDPQAEEFLFRTLMERRKKVVEYGLAATSALDHFRISESAGKQYLEFDDLAGTGGYYVYALHAAGERARPGEAHSFRGRRIPLDRIPGPIVLSICARSENQDTVDQWAHVYLEPDGSGVRVRGWERDWKQRQ